jgi:hypothetical protein
MELNTIHFKNKPMGLLSEQNIFFGNKPMAKWARFYQNRK